MITKHKKMLFFLILLILFPLWMAVAGNEEGGYVGTNDGQGHEAVVYNFLRHFSYDQYYYAITAQFGWNNDNRADDMDISLFGGHGNQYLIATTNGNVNLSTCGSTAAKGLGDDDCEFLALVSCNCVPSPIETANWAVPWFNNNSIFDGLHMVCGFRSTSWQSTDQKISYYFGDKVEAGGKVLDKWLDAIAVKGKSDEKGAVVYCTGCRNDTYYSFAADPPENPTTLYIVYHT